jgi:hypothetical protein
MNAKELLNVLKQIKPVDRENSQIEVWDDEDQEYAINSIRGFSLSPNIVIKIIKKSNSPALRPMTFKAEHKKMVQKKVKEIRGEVYHGR